MLLLPQNVPSAAQLRFEGFEVTEYGRDEAFSRCALPETLHIAFLNLMPEKEQALQDICRVLAFEDKSVKLTLLKFRGHSYKVASKEYMDEYYRDVEDVDVECFDALLVNGAPVEKLPFEDVDYWDSICRLMDVFSAANLPQLYICWASQAALYHFYGIHKYPLGAKRFGIFRHSLSPDFRYLWNLQEEYMYFPVSRHTEVRADDIVACPSLSVVAESEESGVGIVLDIQARRTFITAHTEYSRERLSIEYRRDITRGLPIHVPQNYFQDDNPDKPVKAEWHGQSRKLFHSWLQTIIKG